MIEYLYFVFLRSKLSYTRVVIQFIIKEMHDRALTEWQSR